MVDLSRSVHKLFCRTWVPEAQCGKVFSWAQCTCESINENGRCWCRVFAVGPLIRFLSVSTSPRDSYGGNDLCGATRFSVAMSSLARQDRCLDILDCLFFASHIACPGHTHDSIVFCGLDCTSSTKILQQVEQVEVSLNPHLTKHPKSVWARKKKEKKLGHLLR